MAAARSSRRHWTDSPCTSSTPTSSPSWRGKLLDWCDGLQTRLFEDRTLPFDAATNPRPASEAEFLALLREAMAG